MDLPLLVSRENTPDLYLPLGRENAKTQKAIAKEWGCSVREAQEVIEEARRAGYPVCSDTARDAEGHKAGMYLAGSSEELRESNDRLRARLVTQYRNLRSLRLTERRMRQAEQHVSEPTIWDAA